MAWGNLRLTRKLRLWQQLDQPLHLLLPRDCVSTGQNLGVATAEIRVSLNTQDNQDRSVVWSLNQGGEHSDRSLVRRVVVGFIVYSAEQTLDISLVVAHMLTRS